MLSPCMCVLCCMCVIYNYLYAGMGFNCVLVSTITVRLSESGASVVLVPCIYIYIYSPSQFGCAFVCVLDVRMYMCSNVVLLF